MPGTNRFNIGSPISDPFASSTPAQAQNSPTRVPNFDPWASHTSNSNRFQSSQQQQPNISGRVFNPRDWNVSDKKVSKALTLFNGHAQSYRNWSDRMKDHCKEVNCCYGQIFEIIEAQKTRISNNNLTMGQLEDGTLVDYKWISQHLWVFVGKNIDNDLHGRRMALTQNDADNGFELWRALYVENEGGAEQVALGGMSNLHAFPKCPRVDDLQHWLGQWQMTRQKYGADLPEIHLKQMFLNMLPDPVAEKLRERRDLNTLQQYINEVDADLGRLNDAKLAKLHSQRMANALKAGSRSSVNAVVEEHEPSQTPVMPTGNDEISKKLDTLINVLSAKNSPQPRGRTTDRSSKGDRAGSRERSKSPRGLDPAWEQEGKGCLHCGLKGHNRKNCNKFKKILADNNNSLPAGYKGAYEKWKDQRKKTNVAVVADVCGICEDNLDEFEETDLVWSLPTNSKLPSLTCPCCPVSNKFSELEDDDDENDMMTALQQLTSKIQIGAKVPQKQRKSTRTLSHQQISKIARQVQEGIIDLPSLDLESNEDYEAVWALVDSGAGKSCANKSKHFAHVRTPNRPSQARMATANGQELKSRGTFTVHGFTSEGQKISPDFEDTDVEMPIVAVNDISKEDLEVIFRQEQSELMDSSTGRKSKSVKKKGVYFMKMLYKKHQCDDDCEHGEQPSFTRPGTP